MRKLLSFICLLFVANMASAQVQKVKYSLEYNAQTCLFDVFINIEEGKTKTIVHRAQLHSQITVVAPTASIVNIEESYMPLVDNQQYRSSKPTSWEVTTIIDAPEVTVDKSYHSITPYVSPASFYGDLKQGDKVKLFSMSVSPMVDCAADVKLFENDSDPKAMEPGMQGADFRNGFTVGAVHQSYNGNTAVVRPSAPVIESIEMTSNGLQASVISGSACQSDLAYNWYNGNNLIKTGVKAPSLTRGQIATGNYKLVVSDNMGCKSERVVSLNNEAINPDKSGTLTNEIADANANVFTANVYPNPAKEYFNIEVTGAADKSVLAQMVDTSGKIVRANLLDGASVENNLYRVSVEGMATGAYNVNVVIDGKEVKSQKVIIIK